MASKHGSFGRYLDGCLCDECFGAARRVHAARKLPIEGALATLGFERRTRRVWRFEDRRITHGTRSGYVQGCRRECCAIPQREYQRDYYEKKKKMVLASML
ncbi:MAG TPA: hypothetical protein VG246_13155 [Acidimicrobiales bacterium]|nr:hypothetical protein [Acidimicrobiales bacterium]